MGLKFHWSLYFFFPPIMLARAAAWRVLPVAVILAALWLWLGAGWLDIGLLGIAAVAAAIVAGLVRANSAALSATARMTSFLCAHFIWFALILLPVRWIVDRCLP